MSFSLGQTKLFIIIYTGVVTERGSTVPLPLKFIIKSISGPPRHLLKQPGQVCGGFV